jgi:hypothetical protein
VFSTGGCVRRTHAFKSEGNQVANEPFDQVWLSYGRCCLRDGFFDTFCDTFLEKSPETARALNKTDSDELRRSFENTLAFLMMFHRGKSMATMALSQVARAHNGKGAAAVPPHLYPLWIESLMEAVRQHDHHFSHELAEAWRHALDRGVRYMKSKAP